MVLIILLNMTTHRHPSGPWICRAEYEIYIGNYPVRFKEEDLRDLFKEHNIEVGVIRLKHDGQKV